MRKHYDDGDGDGGRECDDGDGCDDGGGGDIVFFNIVAVVMVICSAITFSNLFAAFSHQA